MLITPSQSHFLFLFNMVIIVYCQVYTDPAHSTHLDIQQCYFVGYGRDINYLTMPSSRLADNSDFFIDVLF